MHLTESRKLTTTEKKNIKRATPSPKTKISIQDVHSYILQIAIANIKSYYKQHLKFLATKVKSFEDLILLLEKSAQNSREIEETNLFVHIKLISLLSQSLSLTTTLNFKGTSRALPSSKYFTDLSTLQKPIKKLLQEKINTCSQLLKKLKKEDTVINNIDQELLLKFYNIGTSGVTKEWLDGSGP